MAYEPTTPAIEELNRDIRQALTALLVTLDKMNAHLEIISGEEDPPREPTEQL